MTHYFHNPGRFDPAFLRMIGISVKQEGAIGQFGTGLKYAIATILRGGGSVRINSFNDTWVLGQRNVTVRGTTQNIVTVSHNGGPAEDLSFATTLGRNWKPWMAFRELWANAKDEGGGYKAYDYEDDTIIEVYWTAFDDLDLDRYFLMEPLGKPYATESHIDVYYDDPDRAGIVFYKGIQVADIPSPFTYILKGETWRGHLSEDRVITYLYPIQYASARALSKNDDWLHAWTICEENMVEELDHMNVSSENEPFFADAVKSGKLQSERAKRIYQRWVEAQPPSEREPVGHEQGMLDRAIAILERGGIDYHYRTIIVDKPYRPAVQAYTDMKSVYIVSDSFNRGVRHLVMCLLEEWSHIHHNVQDETYAMQMALHENWINTYSHLTGDYI